MKITLVALMLLTHAFAGLDRAKVISELKEYDLQLLDHLDTDESNSVIESAEEVLSQNPTEEVKTNFFAGISKTMSAYRAYKKDHAQEIAQVKNMAKLLNSGELKSQEDILSTIESSNVKFGLKLNCNGSSEGNVGTFAGIIGSYQNLCQIKDKDTGKNSIYQLNHYLLGAGLHGHVLFDSSYLFCVLDFPKSKSYNLTVKAGIGALLLGAHASVSVGQNGICLHSGLDVITLGLYAGAGIMTLTPPQR
jgi:hypothetical protein